MKYFLYIAYFLLAPTFATRVDCLHNLTFSGISFGVWLNNRSDCHSCTCYMLTTNSSAANCYNNAINNTSCLIFKNYSMETGGIQLVSGQNGSSACFTQFPPETANPSSLYRVLLLLNSIDRHITHFILSNISIYPFFLKNMQPFSYSYDTTVTDCYLCHFSRSCHHIITDYHDW
jgi:hypothetical protein